MWINKNNIKHFVISILKQKRLVFKLYDVLPSQNKGVKITWFISTEQNFLPQYIYVNIFKKY